jgi:CRP/FNR family transcriptional regulator, anaerobic regulatory protein
VSSRSRLACATCPVRHSAACSVLSDEGRGELAAWGIERHLARGETLFRAETGDAACATLIEGALKLVERRADGGEILVGLVHPAGFAGELFATDVAHDVVALTDSRLCLFPQAAYRRIVDTHPELARALLHRQSRDLVEARHLLGLAARRGARARVAGLLIAFAHAASDSPCHPAADYDLPMTRGDIAMMLGLTIETVSRQLTRLEHEKIILRNGQRGVAILDFAALSIAAGDD